MVELRSIILTWKVVILNSISIIVINAILFRLFYFGYMCKLKLSTDFEIKQCKYIDILMNALYIILNPKNYYSNKYFLEAYLTVCRISLFARDLLNLI